MKTNLMLCDYGCGRESKFHFKNGKYCCERNQALCPESIRKSTGRKKLKIIKRDLPDLCDSGCGKEAKFYFKSVNKWCCSKNRKMCPEVRKTLGHAKGKKNVKISQKLKGKSPWNKGKKKVQVSWSKGLTKEINDSLKKSSNTSMKNKINRLKNPNGSKISMRNYNIISIKIKHKKFFESEDIRSNPNITESVEIQVRCKNPECKNSKENNGWFTPRSSQIHERIRCLKNNNENQKAFFYCSKECKNIFNNYKNLKPKNLNLYIYRNKVYKESEKQIRIYKDKIENIKLRGKYYHIDHIFSISDGFKNCIIPSVVSCYKNLRIISGNKNLIKCAKSEITKEELFSRYSDYLKEN